MRALASERVMRAALPGLSPPSTLSAVMSSARVKPIAVAAAVTLRPFTGEIRARPRPGCSGMRRAKTNSKLAPALVSGSILSASPPARSSMVVDHISTFVTFSAMARLRGVVLSRHTRPNAPGSFFYSCSPRAAPPRRRRPRRSWTRTCT
jgi:hypothetical protein